MNMPKLLKRCLRGVEKIRFNMDKYYNSYEKTFELLHLENTERLLLKAAIQEKPQGTTLINEWQKEVDLNTITECSIELFPFLYFKYKQELDDQFKNIFLGTYRKSFYKNNIILKETCRLSDLLKVNGIPYIFIKGFSLGLRYYKNLAIRPISDSDILVHPQDFQRAIEIALKNGFSDNENQKKGSAKRQIHLYNNDLGVICDLHYDIIDLEGISGFLWDRVEEHYLSPTVSFPVLSAVNEFILTCTHNVSNCPRRTCRWILDAYMILKSEPVIDWDIFIAYAQKSHLRIHLLRTLHYLKTSFDIPINEKYYQKLAVDYPSVEDIKHFVQFSVDVTSRDVPHNFSDRLITFLNNALKKCQIFKVLYGNHPKKLRFYTSQVLILLELPRKYAYNRLKEYLRKLFAIIIKGPR